MKTDNEKDDAGTERLLKAQKAQRVLERLTAGLPQKKSAAFKKGIEHLHRLIDNEVQTAMKELNAVKQPGFRPGADRRSGCREKRP